MLVGCHSCWLLYVKCSSFSWPETRTQWFLATQFLFCASLHSKICHIKFAKIGQALETVFTYLSKIWFWSKSSPETKMCLQKWTLILTLTTLVNAMSIQGSQLLNEHHWKSIKTYQYIVLSPPCGERFSAKGKVERSWSKKLQCSAVLL